MTIDLFNQDGKKTGSVTVDAEIFARKVNQDLMKEVLRYQFLSKRKPIANTKTKAEIRGGGRKPFRQKGLGRARQGSTRSPQYIGGGVTFGPTNSRNFSINIPKKQRRAAIFSALSARCDEKSIIALEDLNLEKIQTKKMKEFLDKLSLRDLLIVVDKKDDKIKKSSNNLKQIKIIMVNYLNVYDLLKYQKICFLKNTLPRINEIFTNK